VSFNGSGLFQINTAGQPVVAGTDIDPTVFNNLTADLATGLSTCITKDGQTTVTANIPMGSNKITGLAAGTARTDAANIGNVQDGTGVYVGTVGGTADVITLTPSPAITSYTAGQTFRFIASGANTTNVTVNVSGLGAKAITKNGTTALAAGDIPSGMMVEITYDGTRFILESAATSTINSPVIVTGTVSANPVTNLGIAPKQYVDTVSPIPSGTLMLFQQTSAPTGWTKQVTHNNKALRVVTGTASSGGTRTFTSVFADHTEDGFVVSHTLVTAEIPSHTHTTTCLDGTGGGSVLNGAGWGLHGAVSTSVGGDGGHGHGLNIAVQYVDLIIASKD
jgi:hypothetical protein